MTDRLRALAATPHARPVDLLAASYLAATGLIAGLSLSSTGLMIAGLHVVALVLVHALGRVSVPVNRPLAFLRLVWPVAITPLLYLELATLNQLLFPG
ncbi:MAG: hypothetical protein OEM23_00305, partial [Gemmatimonadota bacterium]|nr:hypothetical protein [Gemmatimonadota bacterium]